MLTPADKYMTMDAQEVADRTLEQVRVRANRAAARALSASGASPRALAGTAHPADPPALLRPCPPQHHRQPTTTTRPTTNNDNNN